MASGHHSCDPSLTPQEQERYSRHLLLAEIGEQGQLKLKNSSVLVIGAGGLGCPSLQYLVAAGVGRIGIVEDDMVSLSNLQRQVLYTSDHIGQPKGQLAVTQLKAQNPHCVLTHYATRFNADNALALLASFDVILDCTDNFATRYLINDACVLAAKPLVQGSVHRFKGSLTLFDTSAQGPCYRCLFPVPPTEGLIGDCQSEGVLGILPGVIGALQASEAIKYITGIGALLRGRMLYYDALQLSFNEFKISKDLDCPACGAKAQIDLSKIALSCCQVPRDRGAFEITAAKLAALDPESYLLVDIRSAQQRAVAAIPASVPMSVAALSAQIDQIPLQKNIILYCHQGVASLAAARSLSQTTGRVVLSLKDGLQSYFMHLQDEET